MSTKVLVVDDEQDFVELISFNLKEHGYRVLTANNGLDALFKARRSQPDVVILDLMMDGIDGYSVCEILRRQLSTRTMPVIMVTAASGQLPRLNGLAAGANDFLFKPFSPQELVRRVAAVIAESADRQRTAEEEAAEDPDGTAR